jgi:hypothetical protein
VQVFAKRFGGLRSSSQWKTSCGTCLRKRAPRNDTVCKQVRPMEWAQVETQGQAAGCSRLFGIALAISLEARRCNGLAAKGAAKGNA